MAMSLIGLALRGIEIPLIQAKNAGPRRPGQRIDWLVIHTMEAQEKPNTARGVAAWFAGPSAPMASAHYCIDAYEIVQSVPEDVVAWTAPHANSRGIHLEHAGFAGQNAAQWGDDYSNAVLLRSAELASDICRRHLIPIVKVGPDDLRAGLRGICGHVDVTNAFSGGKGHTDPGASFPWDHYLRLISPVDPTQTNIA